MENPIRNSHTLVDLPSLVVEMVAQHLSVRDLGACCASSRSMRDVFSQDCVWRPRCNQDLFHYLEKTDCKVEPHFVSPKKKDSTLSNIPEWKLAYMRENHLWNNWRQGKFKEEHIHTDDSDISDVLSHLFLSNDCVIARYGDRFAFFDVREYPARKVAVDICFPRRYWLALKVSAGDGFIITVLYSLVVMYQVDITKEKSFVKQAFFLEESQTIADISELDHVNVLYTKAEQNRLELRYMVASKFLVGIFKGESKMHIWDIEIGLKIKEEECPVKHAVVEDFKASDTMNIILHVKEKKSDIGIFLAYNLNTFKFLPFNINLLGFYDFCIIDKYVAIWSCGHLNVYNYETSELLLSSKRNQPNRPNLPVSGCQCLGNKFLFIQNRSLKMFQPSNKILKPFLVRTGRLVPLWFVVLGNKFIHLCEENKFTVYEVDECFFLKKRSLKMEFYSSDFYLNETSTRYIVTRPTNKVRVLHFW